ncbi:MAG: hypothetical protein NC418_06630 [Muribaculaceae bacterium]|nr:hypothetical protein [Muribaculaceae bacterium]
MKKITIFLALVVMLLASATDAQAQYLLNQTHYNNVVPTITQRHVGRINLPNGAYFEGSETLTNGQRTGFYGMIYYAEGGFYQGPIDLYMRPHGGGQLVAPNGEVYSVRFENGQLVSQTKHQPTNSVPGYIPVPSGGGYSNPVDNHTATCRGCNGSGDCQHCGGKGYISNGSTCSLCHGGRRCVSCHGTGSVRI